jgi:hypothetical protein
MGDRHESIGYSASRDGSSVTVNLQKVLIATVFISLGIVIFSVGFLRVVGTTDGVAFGVICALFSASAWAASTVVLTTMLNLFAGASTGFLATPDKVCAWHHLPLLCP